MICNAIQTGSFDDDVTRAIGAAFELSCKSLPHPCHSEVVRDLIAQHIVEAANTGERDPAKLSEKALQLSVSMTCQSLLSAAAFFQPRPMPDHPQTWPAGPMVRLALAEAPEGTR